MPDEDKQESPKLDVSDVVNAIQIIDLCTSRGAFKGEELLSVGGVRERLKTFSDYYVQQKTQETPEE